MVCPNTYRDLGSERSGVAAYKNLPARWKSVVKTFGKGLTLIPRQAKITWRMRWPITLMMSMKAAAATQLAIT
jgi:hypothetical protein